jgi:uncharacterized membrane protein
VPLSEQVLLATDGIGVLGTLGFFVPAAIIVALLAVVVVRDRRRDDADGERSGGS